MNYIKEPNYNLSLKNFQNNLKNRLYFFCKTQKELAEDIGVTPGTVCNWCRGLYFPSQKCLYKLCKVLKCTPEDLFN